MNTVDDIKAAISRLSDKDVRDVRDWVMELAEQRWDEQIERDVEAGKLDHLIAEVRAEEAAGRLIDLDRLFERCERRKRFKGQPSE